MIRFYLSLDAASENVKIGWQKLQSTGRFKMDKWRTEVDAELEKQFQGKNS